MRRLNLKSQAGFAMVEALIAWLVLSAGILGIAILFARSLAHSRTALFRTTAVYLTDDLAESIRANSARLADNDLRLWRTNAATALSADALPSVEQTPPAGSGGIARFRVQVLWHEPHSAEPLTATSDLLILLAEPAS